jgi:hypothetical protein
MKTRISVIVVLFVLSLHSITYGQPSPDVQITLPAHEGTLASFLQAISERTGYTFSYINNTLPLQKVIHIANTSAALREILNALLLPIPVRYEIRDTKIILSAQKKKNAMYTVSGFVKDEFSGELLPGATIFVPALSAGTVTNAYGFFSLTVPEQQYELICSYIGYRQASSTFYLDKDLQLTLRLSNADSVLSEVVLNASNENESITTAEMSLVRPDLRVIRHMPALLGEADVVKSIIQLPGVTTVGETAPGFNVRGGGIDQNLVLLDEAPVYNTSHLFGFYSVFNPDAVKDIKLYKGAIPATYGGRLSSVLDITQKEGNNRAFGGSGSIGLVTSHVQAEGPLVKDKSSFLVAARRSYADLLLKHIKWAELDEAHFYDVNAKFNYSLNDRNMVYLSGYTGKDTYRMGEDVDIGWGNSTATLRWNHLFSDKLFSNFTAVYSNYIYRQGEPKGIYAYKGERGIISYHAKADLTWFCTARHQVDFGFSAIRYTLEPGKIKPVDISGINADDLADEHGLEPAVYLSNEYKLTSRLTLNVGLRYSAFYNTGPGNVYVYTEGQPRSAQTITDTLRYTHGKTIAQYGGLEPRVAINFQLAENSAVKLSYSRTRQYLHFISNTTSATPIDFWKASDRYLQPEVADHVAAGYFRNFRDNMFKASLEVYYKSISHLVDYKNGADLLLNPAIDAELLQGRGRAYGAELMVSKTKGKLTGWAGYTYSKTERLVTGSAQQEKINGGKYFPADYDQPHKVNVVAVYDAARRWQLSANFVYSTGRPVTYPQGGYRFNDTFLPYYGSRNESRVADYHRLDLSATLACKRKPGRKWTGSWTFSLYNAYARKNVYAVYFRNKTRTGLQSSRQTEAVELSLLGTVLPSVMYSIKF